MHWSKQPQVRMNLGLSFLVMASLWRWFVHPSARFPEAVVDGASGVLYGVAIALMLLSLRRRRAI